MLWWNEIPWKQWGSYAAWGPQPPHGKLQAFPSCDMYQVSGLIKRSGWSPESLCCYSRELRLISDIDRCVCFISERVRCHRWRFLLLYAQFSLRKSCYAGCEVKVWKKGRNVPFDHEEISCNSLLLDFLPLFPWSSLTTTPPIFSCVTINIFSLTSRKLSDIFPRRKYQIFPDCNERLPISPFILYILRGKTFLFFLLKFYPKVRRVLSCLNFTNITTAA